MNQIIIDLDSENVTVHAPGQDGVRVAHGLRDAIIERNGIGSFSRIDLWNVVNAVMTSLMSERSGDEPAAD